MLLAMVVSWMPALPVSAASNTTPVGEMVDSFTANSQTFTLNADSRFFVVSATEPTGELLQTVQLIQRQFAADSRPSATPMPIAWGPESWITDGDIVIRLDSSSGIAAEGYRLDVTTFAELTVSDVDGLIYGANMLLKHLRYANSNSVQGFTAADAPDTAQRAVSLDCGRKYYSKNWICNFIREMSWMGYNTLEMHFSDDSGFRIDLWDEAYYSDAYQPANDFSWICGSNYTSWTLSAYKNDVDKGKYLTTAEILEIFETAKEYHIDIIPAFDSPSHMDYLTWMYEQNYLANPDYSFYSTYDQKTYYAKDVGGCINYTNSSGWATPMRWPYYSTIDITADQDKAFVFELYIDIANFFKTYAGSTDFSIGADEVNLSTYNLASGYSFAWGFPDFVVYINELNALLNSMDYTMRMYNDFLGSTSYKASSYNFANNIEILYWDSPFEPNSGGATNHTEPVSYYVNKGMTLYNCIQTNTYYALRITNGGSDARSVYNRQWTFYHANEESIFNEWYPADISEHGDYSEDAADVPAANLGGAYFLIWCDYACVSTEQEIWNGVYDKTTQNTGEFYSLRDRMWSNITKMWNADINNSMTFAEFCILRDAYGDFPGAGTTANSCSEVTVLPESTEPVSGYTGGCENFVSYGQVLIINDTAVMSLPCVNAVQTASTALEVASSGDLYTVTRLYENTEGELWYRVVTKTGLVGHIKATDTRYLKDYVDDITITGATTPSAHVAGTSFTIQGVIKSTYNTLTDVSVYIHSGFGSDGTKVTGYSDTVMDNYYSLLNSAIDNNTLFNKVSQGQHTYIISVRYQSSYADGNTIVSDTKSVNLVEEYFVAIAAAVDQNTCSHSYSETVIKKSDCVNSGISVFGCSTCGDVYEKITTNGGHDYATETIGATCTEYEKVRYTCKLCGDSYVAYPEYLMSQWQETKPEGLDDSLIETKEVYRYADKETLTSSATSLEGYTQSGSQWVKASSGAVQYVNSWPSGFSTGSTLYTQFNNKADKVTTFENDTSKRVVDSDVVCGYLYYHWCYNNSYYSTSSRTGSYTTFHAYYSTVAPSNYVCDYSDYSYKTSHATCPTNSKWFFVAYVYQQSYTDYNKLYTYERWTDWSDWSDVPITATSDRKVEKGTLYRYVDADLLPHTYDSNGICTQCSAVCPHNYKNNICTDCGQAKPVYDYYLFGWINGTNYACEENASQLGEYKFVDGQVVVLFSQDSYVGIKASNNTTYYMTNGWQGYVSSATLYNTTKLTTPDKMFVPGGTEVTFTLTDNGDDTYLLSYVAVECEHISHTTDGICTVCGSVVDHAYGTDGFCVCGLECAHNMTEGFCTICGKECDHAYKNNVCTICNMSKPVQDYYLFGYINGADYACESDYTNLGEYKFVDGKVTVRFTKDSYVAVKAADNAHWYMTSGWQGYVNSAVLYNTKVLSNADKLYVPGGKLVTFTLVDNGDDTYVLSYEAECAHLTHGQDGICPDCEDMVLHAYQNNVCQICGLEKPVLDYYLFGYINGADYADKADKDNLGIYRFVNGSLVVYFTADSYVGVKSSDNLSWYMTDGYQEGKTSVTLVNAESILTEDKLLVPGNMKVTFTLVDNGDDTYVLSYVAVQCPHESHSIAGICDLCRKTVTHSYVDGVCECGAACKHSFKNGACSNCGIPCSHSWGNGTCTICGIDCTHSWTDGICDTCGIACSHNWVEGECTVCGIHCDHSWVDGSCTICGFACVHVYKNNICTICAFPKPLADHYLFGEINGADYAWGANADDLGEYKFVDGKLVVVFSEESYVGIKADNNSGWYMTDGDQGNATSVMLYNTAVITEGTLLTIPGGLEITFILVDNGDDTFTLSYTTAPCPHHSHSTNGVCTDCGTAVSHSYESNVILPTCTTGGYVLHSCYVCGSSYVSNPVAAYGHTWTGGSCTEAKICSDCGVEDGVIPGHQYERTIISPDCTNIGYTKHTCTACGYSYVDNHTAALGHVWKEAACLTPKTCYDCGVTEGEPLGHSYKSVITAPTCTTDGYTTHTCTTCGFSYTDNETTATGHNWTAANCTAAASCSTCGAVKGAALGHSYNSVVTKPTCTTSGYTTHTCTVCGDSYKDSIIAAYGHDWIAATCTTAEVCATCGEVGEKAPGHSYKAVVTEPTCTSGGYTTYTCTACGDSYTGNTTSATGHSWIAATCTTAETCGTCGEVRGEALGHRYNPVITTPTCTTGGYTTHICTVCGDRYQDSAVEAYGHSWIAVTCTEPKTCKTCGTTEGKALGHSYVSQVTQPTCTEIGYTTHTCSVCNHSYVDGQTAALGHAWRDATCLIAKTCSACGVTEGEALGHNYEATVIAPTCTAGGYTIHTCSACGDSYQDSTTNATGHSYVAVVTAPTCTAEGYTTHTCSGCGDSYTDSKTASIGHSYTDTVKAPSCTTVGYTTHSCIRCDYKYSDSVVAAIGHKWVDGTCANCGETCNHSFVDGICPTCGKLEFAAPPVVTLSHPTLAFEDEIRYNIYFKVSDMTSVVEMGLISFADRNYNGTIADAQEVISGYTSNADGSFTAQSNGVSARRLGDAMFFKVYAKLTDGSYAYSDVVGYHAVAYANTILNNPASSAKAKALVVAMLNYGAAAQTYFGYKTDSLMNAGLTAEQQALVREYDSSMIEDVVSTDSSKVGVFVMNGGYSNIHPTVSFQGAFSINYYFTPKYTPADGVTFYYWTSEDYNSADVLSPENATGSIKMTSTTGEYSAAVRDISARQIDETIYIAAVYNSASTGTAFYTSVIAYSLGAYCESLANNGNAFGAATGVYGYYAKAYFAN